MFGIGGVTSLGVRDPREAVADVTLILPGHAGSYPAQRVYGIRMKYKAYTDAAGLEGIRDHFCDQDLAQVAHVDVTRGTDSGYDYMRPFTIGN
jgi:hypothetical protein